MKTCSTCKKLLPRDSFYADRQKADGLYSSCSNCSNAKKRKAFYLKKPLPLCIVCLDRASLKRSHFCKNCKDRFGGSKKEPKPKAKGASCRRCGHPPVAKMTRCYRCMEFERQRARERYKRLNLAARVSLRRKTDLQAKLRDVLRGRLNKAVRGQYKAGSAVKLLGCSILEFKTYLESQFQSGMSWENYGKGHNKWQIDHIRPLFSFDLTDERSIAEACHYTNMQPLWQAENISKGCKYQKTNEKSN